MYPNLIDTTLFKFTYLVSTVFVNVRSFTSHYSDTLKFFLDLGGRCGVGVGGGDNRSLQYAVYCISSSTKTPLFGSSPGFVTLCIRQCSHLSVSIKMLLFCFPSHPLLY